MEGEDSMEFRSSMMYICTRKDAEINELHDGTYLRFFKLFPLFYNVLWEARVIFRIFFSRTAFYIPSVLFEHKQLFLSKAINKITLYFILFSSLL